MQFKPFNFDARPLHSDFWAKTPVRMADETFTNIWAWAPQYGIEYGIDHDLMWIRQTKMDNNPVNIYWSPIGDWEKVDWENIVSQIPSGTVWERVPISLCEKLTSQFPSKVRMVETRGHWEYLYPQASLSTLSGNKLHKKKNHFNAYKKSYGLDYRRLESADIENMLKVQYEWCKYHECERSMSLEKENDALLRVLAQWDMFPNLITAAMFVEDKITAFTIGEPLDSKTFVVHFEKGLPNYRGSYQAINLCFAKDAAAGFEFIDREQDMDEDGLRQAKESYFPSGFIVKNMLEFC